jgi:hypothetical protein
VSLEEEGCVTFLSSYFPSPSQGVLVYSIDVFLFFLHFSHKHPFFLCNTSPPPRRKTSQAAKDKEKEEKKVKQTRTDDRY